MKTLVRPQPVELELPLPSYYVEGEPHGIPLRTAFFRSGTRLAEAFDTSVASLESDEDFSVISAGCSIGAELDSVLALYRASDARGRVWATGFDASSVAIKAARRGQYTVNRALHPKAGRTLESLESLGFATEIRDPESGNITQEPYGVIDSTPIREGHKVDFAKHDLSKALPAFRLSHLILVNNLLYHLDSSQAVQVIRNLSRALGDGGVMSFDAHTMLDSPRARTLSSVMTEELGMEPLRHNWNGPPTMFAKSQ